MHCESQKTRFNGLKSPVACYYWVSVIHSTCKISHKLILFHINHLHICIQNIRPYALAFTVEQCIMANEIYIQALKSSADMFNAEDTTEKSPPVCHWLEDNDHFN